MSATATMVGRPIEADRVGQARVAERPSVMLSVEGLAVRFGGVTALEDVTFCVARGSVHGLIGPNGAGKTTLLNAVSGLVRPQAGTIRLAGREIGSLPAHRRAALGLARTFQNFGLVADQSVLANVLAGAHCRHHSTLVDEAFRPRRCALDDRRLRDFAMTLLNEFELAGEAALPVRGLSYGRRKSVELARALMAQPSVLMLDEPTAGLGMDEMEALAATLGRLRGAEGMTLLMISHHMEFLMALADSVSVLDLGRHLVTDAPARIREDPRVISAYLGADPL